MEIFWSRLEALSYSPAAFEKVRDDIRVAGAKEPSDVVSAAFATVAVVDRDEDIAGTALEVKDEIVSTNVVFDHK